jgi:hypothetical protein
MNENINTTVRQTQSNIFIHEVMQHKYIMKKMQFIFRNFKIVQIVEINFIISELYKLKNTGTFPATIE